MRNAIFTPALPVEADGIDIVVIGSSIDNSSGIINGPFGLTFTPGTIASGQSSYAAYPCQIQPIGGTQISVYGTSIPYVASYLTLSAVNASRAVLAASSSKMVYSDHVVFSFAPTTPVDAAGFVLSFTPGLLPGEALQTGYFGVRDYSRPAGLITGHEYSIESAGGPFHNQYSDLPNRYDYTIELPSGQVYETFGAQDYNDGGSWYGTCPPWASGMEFFGGHYARIYFTASFSYFTMRTNVGVYAWGPQGGLNWILRGPRISTDGISITVDSSSLQNVGTYSMSPRRLLLRNASLYNICLPGM